MAVQWGCAVQIKATCVVSQLPYNILVCPATKCMHPMPRIHGDLLWVSQWALGSDPGFWQREKQAPLEFSLGGNLSITTGGAGYVWIWECQRFLFGLPRHRQLPSLAVLPCQQRDAQCCLLPKRCSIILKTGLFQSTFVVFCLQKRSLNERELPNRRDQTTT